MIDAAGHGRCDTSRMHTLRPHQRTEAARLHSEAQSLGKIAALLGCGQTVLHRAIHGNVGRGRTVRAALAPP
jgi:hypothetical protein